MSNETQKIEKNLTDWLKGLGAIEGQKSGKTASGTPYMTVGVGGEKKGEEWASEKRLNYALSIFKRSIETIRTPESQIIVREWPHFEFSEENRFSLMARLAFEDVSDANE